jgi:hypothetical protein
MLNSGKLVSFEKTLFTRESLIYKNDLLVIIHNEKFPDKMIKIQLMHPRLGLIEFFMNEFWIFQNIRVVG